MYLSPSVEVFSAQHLGELCVYVSFEALARKQLQVSTGADLGEPWPNKFGNLPVLEHIKIHTQMPPEGHTCKGSESNPLSKLTHYTWVLGEKAGLESVA